MKIVKITIFSILPLLSFADEVLDFGTVLKNYIYKESTYDSETGKLTASLPLKRFGDDEKVEDQLFFYSVKSSSGFLNVVIPIGQYYLDFSDPFFNGITHCDIGLFSSGLSVIEVENDAFNEKSLYVKTAWSCGSLGCSYDLDFGNSSLINACEEGK